MGKVFHFNDQNFKEQVLESDLPVVVDFWATWCAPCRMMTPVIEELSVEYEGRARIGKVNTEESPQLAGEYGITGIPALIIFKDGKPIDQIIGAVPKEVVAEKLNNVL